MPVRFGFYRFFSLAVGDKNLQKMESLPHSLPVIPPEVFTVFVCFRYVFGGPVIPHSRLVFGSLGKVMVVLFPKTDQKNNIKSQFFIGDTSSNGRFGFIPMGCFIFWFRIFWPFRSEFWNLDETKKSEVDPRCGNLVKEKAVT